MVVVVMAMMVVVMAVAMAVVVVVAAVDDVGAVAVKGRAVEAAVVRRNIDGCCVVNCRTDGIPTRQVSHSSTLLTCCAMHNSFREAKGKPVSEEPTTERHAVRATADI